MDQDGANHRYLTDGSSLVLTPRFSPSLQEITYLSYAGGESACVHPRYRQQPPGGARRISRHDVRAPLLAGWRKAGSSVSPSTAIRRSTPSTCVLAPRRRLTNNAGIDTSPSYAPDGRQIVFNSDRGGSQQLYVMDADGGNVRRISHGQGRYFTPVWSPRGDLIAFTKMLGGKFYIGVMYPDGGGERLLAEGYHVEGPTWAPNGRVLMYFRKDPGDSAGAAAVRGCTAST